MTDSPREPCPECLQPASLSHLDGCSFSSDYGLPPLMTDTKRQSGEQDIAASLRDLADLLLAWDRWEDPSTDPPPALMHGQWGRQLHGLAEQVQALQQRCGELEQSSAIDKAEREQIVEAYSGLPERIAALEGALREAFDIVEDAPELNMGNYDDDEVRALNDAMMDLYKLLKPALAPGGDGGEGQEPEGDWQPGIECEHGYDACPICDKPRPTEPDRPEGKCPRCQEMIEDGCEPSGCRDPSCPMIEANREDLEGYGLLLCGAQPYDNTECSCPVDAVTTSGKKIAITNPKCPIHGTQQGKEGE